MRKESVTRPTINPFARPLPALCKPLFGFRSFAGIEVRDAVPRKLLNRLLVRLFGGVDAVVRRRTVQNGRRNLLANLVKLKR